MDIKEVARKYALKNAAEHDGQCNPGAVVGKVMAEIEDADPSEVGQIAGQIGAEVNSMSIEEQQEALQDYEFEEEERKHDPIPDLRNADEGEVVVRFAPNPNAPPHLGHARGMVINGELRDKYDGKLVLRFDDTDPRKKRPMKDAYEMYRQDYEWLGYNIDEVRYCSKNFDTYIEYAEKLIEMEKAYVCSCSQEEGQKYRKEGEPCPHRSQNAAENMKLWENMRNGGIEEGGAVLKIKTDMQHKNPAVRDFVAFRIIENPDHPVTGDKYRVWPLLDFQGGIEDHEMGTTHIVRGKDLRASTERQKYIYNYLDWEYPEVRYWGNVRISGFNAPVSSSTLKEMIEKGELDGWSDPRAPTIRALKKRGFEPEAIQNFFIDMGVNEKDIEASVETLESFNREIVEEKDRYYFVPNPKRLEIIGVPENVGPEIPYHPDHPERGFRHPKLQRKGDNITVIIDENDYKEGFVRLKGFCNIKISEGMAKFVEGDHKIAMEKDADIIQWVPENSSEASVVMPNGSIKKGRIEENDINPESIVQFERFGFVRKNRSDETTFYYAHK